MPIRSQIRSFANGVAPVQKRQHNAPSPPGHDPLRDVEPGAREVGATRHVYHAPHRTAVPVRVRVALLGIPIGGMKRSAAGIFASSLASSA